MDSIWWAVIIGLILGSTISVIFGIVSRKDTDKATRIIFGMTSTQFVTNSIVVAVVGGIVFLSVLSVFMKDLYYPRKSPLKFTAETLLMAAAPSSVLFLMTTFRGQKITMTTAQEFAMLFMKFGLLHILLQFSGVYTSLIVA